MARDDLRRIPAVDALLQRPAQSARMATLPRELVRKAVRDVLSRLREEISRAPSEAVDALLEPEALDARVAAALEQRLRPSLVPVLNATGVVVHTNLGRAPLGERALAAVERVARGYSNLEYDLAAGGRGSRHVHVDALFSDLTGAEAALVVNNNAAALVLVLATFASGREVVVSRGELIEIGGSFRLPEIMAASGARLREVGTTNRTRAADYEAAVGPETALLLKAHRSNFAIVGFTEEPELAELVAVGRRHDLPVVYDIGSGTPAELPFALPESTWLGAPLEAGVSLLCFSGDKMLGGPQCGVLLGDRASIDRLRRHPLTRAFRVGKLTIAALEATVRAWLDGTFADEVPTIRMLGETPAALEARARRLTEHLRALAPPRLRWSIVAGSSTVGGGALPGSALPTWLVALEPEGFGEAALEAALRRGEPPLLARIGEGRVLLDVRTLSEADLPLAAGQVRAAADELVG